MSNARYFADGTDYWRVVDASNGVTEGPYATIRGAKSALAYRESRSGGFKIQKLTAVVNQNQDYTKDITATLEWVDVED